jgi:hypothetical protein
VAAALILSTASSAAAQNRLGVGLSFLHESGSTSTGATVDYSGPIQNALAWVGDVSLHRNSNDFGSATITMAQAGLRYNVPMTNSNVRVGVQGLVGLAHEGISDCDGDFCGSNNLVITPGGNVDIPVGSGSTAIRVALDFPIIMFEGATTTFTRFWVGASWGFGAKP